VPTVVAAKPAAVLVLAGTNDALNAGASANIPASAISNLEAIYAALAGAGITPIALTIPPSSGILKPIQQLNAWIKRHAALNGLPLVDLYAVLADQATAGYKTGYDDGDGIHMSPQGAQVAGQAVSDTLTTWLPPHSPWLACSNADTTGIGNPLMLTDTNADGVPDNFAIDGFSAGVGVLASDANVLGNKWTVTRAGTDLTARNLTALTAAAGDRVAGSLRFNTSGLTASATGVMQIGLMAGDNSTIARAMNAWGRDMATWTTVYFEATIPAGKTNAFLWVRAQTANFSIVLGQFTLLNLTAVGLTA
jgi:hypothetical protein